MAGEDPAQGRRGPLAAGRVGRAHGLHGCFYVADARPLLLQLGTVVTVDKTARAIVRLAGTSQRPIVCLQGVDDRDVARALHGMALTVEAELASQLGDGEWWAEELEGCTVTAGELVLGAVTRVIALPSCEALEVRDASGETLLVPMVKDAIQSVIVADRRIEVSLDFLGLADVPGQPPGRRARARPRGEGRRG